MPRKRRMRPRRSVEERNDLALENRLLVPWTLARFAPRVDPETWNDVLQAGEMGLLHAATYWSSRRGRKFSTYAVLCIRGYALTEMKRHDTVSVPTKYSGAQRQALMVRPDRLSRLDDWEHLIPDRSDDHAATESRLDADALLGLLEPAEAAVVRRRLGGETCEAIGRDTKLSRESVRKLHLRALERMRTAK